MYKTPTTEQGTVDTIFAVEEEIESLLGPCDRSTEHGRILHNRKSYLYGLRKKLMVMLERHFFNVTVH